MSILDEELWEKGARSRGSMRQMRRFVAKLEAGQPVTAGEPGSKGRHRKTEFE